MYINTVTKALSMITSLVLFNTTMTIKDMIAMIEKKLGTGFLPINFRHS